MHALPCLEILRRSRGISGHCALFFRNFFQRRTYFADTQIWIDSPHYSPNKLSAFADKFLFKRTILCHHCFEKPHVFFSSLLIHPDERSHCISYVYFFSGPASLAFFNALLRVSPALLDILNPLSLAFLLAFFLVFFNTFKTFLRGDRELFENNCDLGKRRYYIKFLLQSGPIQVASKTSPQPCIQAASDD